MPPMARRELCGGVCDRVAEVGDVFAVRRHSGARAAASSAGCSQKARLRGRFAGRRAVLPPGRQLAPRGQPARSFDVPPRRGAEPAVGSLVPHPLRQRFRLTPCGGIADSSFGAAHTPPDKGANWRARSAPPSRARWRRHAFVDSPVGFAHARLSIIDLATGGSRIRPTNDTCGSSSTARSSTSQVGAAGSSPRPPASTHSDTEVIVHPLRSAATTTVDRLNGQFASIALGPFAAYLVLRDRAAAVSGAVRRDRQLDRPVAGTFSFRTGAPWHRLDLPGRLQPAAGAYAGRRRCRRAASATGTGRFPAARRRAPIGDECAELTPADRRSCGCNCAPMPGGACHLAAASTRHLSRRSSATPTRRCAPSR